ncbi:MAG: AbrB/MazE/SpoVT family DNA-binding domain-containing protein [Thermotogota bacterium]
MKTKLIKIGNSRGIRLPKAILDHVGLVEEAELDVHEGRLIITPMRPPRSGWADAAREMQKRGEGKALDGDVPTRFDVEEWTW